MVEIPTEIIAKRNSVQYGFAIRVKGKLNN